MNITAAIIFRKNASDLDRALTSIRPWVDRIVAVNTSPDGEDDEGAVAVCEKHGADVYRFPWIEDFAAARNFALEQIADDDWVFNFDSDEELPQEEGPKLRKLVELAEKPVVYTSLVLQPPGFTTSSNSRLFPRKGAFWIQPIHEDIRHDPMLPWVQSGLVVKHHYDSREERDSRNLKILEREIEAGRDPDGFMTAYLAMQLMCTEPESPRIDALSADAVERMPAFVPVGKRLGMLLVERWLDKFLLDCQALADKGYVGWDAIVKICGVLVAKGDEAQAKSLAQSALKMGWDGMGFVDELRDSLAYYAGEQE